MYSSVCSEPSGVGSSHCLCSFNFSFYWLHSILTLSNGQTIVVVSTHTHIGMLFLLTNACYFLSKIIVLKCLLVYYAFIRTISVNIKVQNRFFVVKEVLVCH